MEKNNQSSSGRPSLPVGMIDLFAMRYKTILGMIFIHPKLGLTLAALKRCWLSSFLVLMVIGISFSIFKGWVDSPKHAKDIKAANQFILGTVPGFTLSDNRFSWDNELSSPAYTYLSHFRFDIAEKKEDLDALALRQDIIKQGLILVHDGLYFWTANPAPTGKDTFLIHPIIDSSLLEKLSLARGNTDFLQLNPKDQTGFCAAISLFITLMTTLSLMIDFISSVGITVFFFTLISLITRRRTPLGGFASALSSSLTVCIPPALGTVIYMCFDLSNNFDDMFSLMFLIYLVFFFIEGRRQGLVAIPQQRPPQR